MYHEPAFEPVRDEMLAILDRYIPHLKRTVLVPLAEADGCVAAEDILAPYSLPNRAVSGCDGIAVRFKDLKDANFAAWQEGREYVYSNTGVAVPEAYDTVIPIEEVTVLQNGGLSLRSLPDREGEEVQPAGSQIREREVLVACGERLNPITLGILLSAGLQSVNVYDAPRVLFLPTGDELVPSGGAVPPGLNVESNSLMVSAMLRRFGCRSAFSHILPDEPSALEAALREGVRQADLVIIGAGSSKGNKDFTMDVLCSLGEVIVQEIGVAPGKHCSLTMIDGVPVLGIPGPPGGAQLICQYYVRAAAELLIAGQRSPVFRVSARLSVDLPARPIDFMQPVELIWENGFLQAVPLPPFGMTRAEKRKAYTHILYCPKGEQLHSGDMVSVELPLANSLF